MQLHNLLTSKERDGAEGTGIHRSSSTVKPKVLAKKSKSKPLPVEQSGENLVKEIQAMIISQELQRKNKAKLAQVGGHHAHRFLSDPKLNERKTIEEKFQRKHYTSLAVDLYKSKLQNNPMRQDQATPLPGSLPTGSSLGHKQTPLLAITAADKENMPVIPVPNIDRNEAIGGPLSKGGDTRMKLYGAAVDGAHSTFDRRNHAAPQGLLPLAPPSKQTFYSQTLSSQYRTQQTAKSFEGKHKFTFSGTHMPEVVTSGNTTMQKRNDVEVNDMSLA